jgi:membrane fusion protein (multidrug efflux system)
MSRQTNTSLKITSLIAIVLILAAAGCKKEEAAPVVQQVKVTKVIQQTVPIYFEAIGQTRGSVEVEVRARVNGIIETIDFEEGKPVKKGQLLCTIDPQQYQAALATAKGKYAQANADYEKAKADVTRYKPLVAANAISREEYETAVSKEAAASAQVEAAKGAVKTAEIDLGYCRVTAPVGGLIGKTEMKSGNLVSPDRNLIASISQINPIHVRINIAEKDYIVFAKKKAATPKGEQKVRDDIEMVLGDGLLYPQRGKTVFIDRQVDPATGTIMLEVAFPNPDSIVRPGQYARLRSIVDTKENAILVPQKAVQELQATFSVSVVGQDNKVATRKVEVGEKTGTLWIIKSGVNVGERVVVEGVQKVRDGMTVQVSEVAVSDSLKGN